MNQRPQLLMLLLAGVPALAGVLYLGWLHAFTLAAYDAQIADLDKQLSTKNQEISQITRNRDLRRWRELSLPTDVHLAQREYNRFLHDLLHGKVSEMSLTPNPPVETKGQGALNKKTLYTALTFNVRGKTTLKELAGVLEKFERTPLVHKIKSLSLERETNSDENSPLRMQLAVEALIVDGAMNAPADLKGIDVRLVAVDVLSGLRRGPIGLALAPWVVGPRGPAGQYVALATPRRTYSDIAARNIFTGAAAPKPPTPPPTEPTEVAKEPEPEPEPDETPLYIYLTEINQTDAAQEAFLFNRATNRSMRLRVTTGFDSFPIGNDPRKKTPIIGKVVRIDPRDVFFSLNEAIYGIHIGQTLSEALRRPLRQTELEQLRLRETPTAQTAKDAEMKKLK